MDILRIYITLLVICAISALGRAACTFNLPQIVSVNETAPINTEILSFTKTENDRVWFNVTRPADPPAGLTDALQSSFQLIIENTSAILVNARILDLENFHMTYGADITSIELKIHCDGAVSPKEVIIDVQPVNEFHPVFLHGPFYVTLNESTPVGTTVFTLRDKVQDGDFGEPENFNFDIEPYKVTDFDGRDFFSIPTKTKGDIVIAKPLDYDNTAFKHNMTLNLTVADGGGLKKDTTMTVRVLDVDDQRPYFEFPDCALPCPVPPFVAITELAYTGRINVLPVPLQGRDRDTLGTRLLYSIISGNEANMFSVDENSGEVNQDRSVNQAGSPEAEFRLVLELRKDLPIDLSAIAVLTVKVRERMPNDTGIPPQVGESSTKNEGPADLLIPMIVLGVLLAAVIAALIVVVVMFRKNKSRMSIRPTDDKSEPQTEEEELHTEGEDFVGRADSNEKLVFGNKTTLGIMTDLPPTPVGRANQLAPLPYKDTGTVTEGKKKRSRRRNKKKEPEIFDGTKEYNMGADPEFFDSTDKSKIKRSQRSKKADNFQPITVPNDEPPVQRSIYS